MATPEEFERQMVEFGLTAERNAVVAVRRGFLSISRRIITETPVDRGEAVSSWIASKGAPASGTRPPFWPGRHGSTADANRNAAIEEATAIADTYDRSGEELHLANNTRQIGFLNAGSSKQAGPLFVETAVAEGAQAIKYVKVL